MTVDTRRKGRRQTDNRPATTPKHRLTRDRRPRPGRRWGRWLVTPYVLLLPALALELLVHIVPMVVGAWMSFLRLTQFYIRNWLQAPPAGLANYRVSVNINSAAGAALLHSWWVTLVFTVLVVAGAWVLGFVAAILLQNQRRGRGLLRTLFLVPYALPLYTTVIAWSFMFQRDNGLVNHLLVDNLHLLGTRPFWLIGQPSLLAMVITALWRNWPFAFLIIMAGLQNVPTELYEAATIDGAGIIAQIRRITLPMLRPVNQVLILVLFLWNFNDFNTPYVLFGQSAPAQADLVSIHIYTNSFVTWNFGLGSAMSVLMLLFLLLVTAIYLLATARRRTNVV